MTQSAAESQGTPVWVRATGVVSGLLGGLAWLLLFGVLLFIVPKFEEMFVRFEIKSGLPAPTKILITLSRILRVAWPLAAAIMFGIPAASILLSVFARSSKGAAAAVVFGLGSLLIVLVVLPVIVTGLFLPLLDLMQSASGKP